MLKKIITWAVVIFIAIFLLTKQQGASDLVQGLVSLLKDAGNSLASFINNDL